MFLYYYSLININYNLDLSYYFILYSNELWYNFVYILLYVSLFIKIGLIPFYNYIIIVYNKLTRFKLYIF